MFQTGFAVSTSAFWTDAETMDEAMRNVEASSAGNRVIFIRRPCFDICLSGSSCTLTAAGSVSTCFEKRTAHDNRHDPAIMMLDFKLNITMLHRSKGRYS